MISVIVPVYKVEDYMDKCIASILGQTFTDYELILVDDGSPDNCPAKCDEWAAKDPRIRVLHMPHRSLSDARNEGLEIALGEYVCFVDSDDWIAPDMLETLYQLIRDTGTDLAICNYMRVNLEGEPVKEPHHFLEGVRTQETFWEQFFNERNDRTYYAVSWNKIYKRKLFDHLQFCSGRIHQDIYLLYDLISACTTVALSDKIVYYYLQRDTGIVKSGRSLKNLTEPEAYLNMVEPFMAQEKWDYAGCALDIASRYLLRREYGENGKSSPVYLAVVARAEELYRKMAPHLPLAKRIRLFFFFKAEPLAHLAEDLLTHKREYRKKTGKDTVKSESKA